MVRRFSSSLLQVPAQTRTMLRDRLTRLLPVQIQAPRSVSRVGELLSDELVLELLLNLDIGFASDLQSALARYDAARSPDCDELSFEQMRDAGWFRVVWGRVSMPYDMWRVVHSQPHEMPGFKAVFDTRFDQEFRASKAVLNSPALSDIAGRVERGELAVTDMGFRDAAWIAARLWERTYSKSTNLEVTLREWIDRWKFLGFPHLVPGQVWDGEAAESFRQTALKLLQTETALQGWDETRRRFVNQTALAQSQDIKTVESYIPEVPTTLFDRILWLNRHPCRSIFSACTLSFLVIIAMGFLPVTCPQFFTPICMPAYPTC